MRQNAHYPFYIIILFLLASCANVSHPTGGNKDIKPPRLLSVSPKDSQLNTRVKKIELKFDEFVQVNNANDEVHISPLLTFSPTVEAMNRKVVVKIADSLLQDNTTYRISFGKAIGDIHENNAFTGYSYIFSTGSYFDSLQLKGTVIDAATGMNDTGATILLYDAAKSDSAVLREKPLYVTKTSSDGSFTLDGLPNKPFKIYALKEKSGNMIYDGTDEMIAFSDSIVHPNDSALPRLVLYIFSESDSASDAQQSSSPPKKETSLANRNNPQKPNNNDVKEGFTYSVLADTMDKRKRTQDIISPISITFNQPVNSINEHRVSLSYDSTETSVEAACQLKKDTTDNHKLLLATNWKENTLYTLRLLKGFSTDSAGTDAMPSKHIFRTKMESDYAKLKVNLPSKFYGKKFVFVLLKDGKTFYQKPVTDSIIRFVNLQPATYTMRIIEDANENGKWDHGKLLEKIQPEKVFADHTAVTLKSGWENIVDFKEQVQSLRNNSLNRKERRR